MAKSAVSIISFILNIIYVASGVLLALASVLYYTEMQVIKQVRNNDLHVISSAMSWAEIVPYVFFSVGVLVAIVSVCGCTGAYSKVALIVYITFLLVAVGASVAATIFVSEYADSEITDTFVAEIVQEGVGEITGDVIKSEDDTAFGSLEEKYSCCGYENANDYIHLTAQRLYPKSCCRSDHSCPESSHGDSVQILSGCGKVVIHKTRKFIKHLWWACAGVSGIGFINLVVAIFALLRKVLKNKKRKAERFEHETQLPLNGTLY